MASYTMELRTYIEAWSQFDPNPNLTTREKIEIGRKKLFDFDYPIFDPNYKAVFETNFIRNFYMTEIGFETEEYFKFQLETWMRINMTYFNKLWESELLKYNPLFNTDFTEDSNRKNDKGKKDVRDTTQKANTTGTTNGTSSTDVTSSGESNGTSTDDNFNRKLESDNPDSRLTLTTNDGEGVISYASKIDENNENNSNTSHNESTGESHSDSTDSTDTTTNSTADQNDVLTSDINEVEDYLNHKVGKAGSASYPQLVKEYRESLLRIEQTIFAELRTKLFMLVY
ncbi:MAG: hypothetical protein WBZ57_05585 [Pseudomonas graminis]